MNLFEKFNPFKSIKPESEAIEKDNGMINRAINKGILKEEGFEEAKEELNENVRIKEVISGKDPMASTPEDQEAVENLLVRSAEDFEIMNNNIELLRSDIENNKEKIKQLDVSILKTKEEVDRAEDNTMHLNLEQLTRMKSSLEKLNIEKEEEIRLYESKMKNFYNLN